MRCHRIDLTLGYDGEVATFVTLILHPLGVNAEDPKAPGRAFRGLCRSQHGDLGYYIAANADDYFQPSHRRPLLQCCRRLATPSLVAFATDQIYRSLQGRVTTATPMPEALDFMGGLTIKPS